MSAAMSTDSGSYVLSKQEALSLNDVVEAAETASQPVTTLTGCAQVAERYLLAGLELAATAFVMLVFAPLIGASWLAVWVHQRDMDDDPESEPSPSSQQAWQNEMHDFDRF